MKWQRMRDEEGNSQFAAQRTTSFKNTFFTILLVDENESDKVSLDTFLKTENIFTLKAGSGGEALTLTQKYQPDLILLDSQVEGESALTLLPELLIEHPTAAVIVMVASLSFFETVTAMKLGAVNVLERPVDLMKLKTDIETQKLLFKNNV